MRGEDDTPDDLYASAVGNDHGKQPTEPEAEPDLLESNSSNYGGSALADKPIEDRVLHPSHAEHA